MSDLVKRLRELPELAIELCEAEEGGSILRITWPDGQVQEERDYGEPEDNSFHRDWWWVLPTIQNAFREGRKWASADRLEKLERVAEGLRRVKQCEERSDMMGLGNAWQDVNDYLAALDAEGET